MSGRIKIREHLGWAWRLSIGLLRPILMLITKREWVGVERLPPQGGVIVTPNHHSHIDPLTFAHCLVDNGRLPRFLAKDSLFTVPLVRQILVATGQVPVHRLTSDAASAFHGAVQAVQDGKVVVVYPEGTITRDVDLWPMVGKTGAARIALASGVDVVPVAQWGAQDLLYPYAKWPKILPRKTMHIRFGAPVPLDDLRGRPLTNDVLHEATERIMTAITSELEIIRGEKAPAVRFDPRKAGVAQIGNPHKKRRR
jgi:1-acyl-sn-glycerol-3-phosphate acyltransferase